MSMSEKNTIPLLPIPPYITTALPKIHGKNVCVCVS